MTHTTQQLPGSALRQIFRPVGRSADIVGILADETEVPVGVINEDGLRLLESDKVDEETVWVTGIVNSFSRSSKTGIVFSPSIGRGFRFEYVGESELRRRDVFSWSQYYGREIKMHGRFIRFFDGTIKKFDVYKAEKSEEIEE